MHSTKLSHTRGFISLGAAMVRVLDSAKASEDESDGIARLDSGSLHRRRLSGGRLQRAVSAPAPPLISLLSRTGEKLEGLELSRLCRFCRRIVHGNRTDCINSDFDKSLGYRKIVRLIKIPPSVAQICH